MRWNVFVLHPSEPLRTTVIMAVVSVAGLLNAAEPKSQQQATPLQVVQHEEWHERSYDVTSVIQRIAAEEGIPTDEAMARCGSVLRFIANRGRPSGSSELNESRPSVQSSTDEQSAIVTISAADDAWQLDLWASEAAHADVERVLRAWAKGGLRQIMIEVRIATAKRKLEDLAGIQWTSLLTDSSYGSQANELGLVHAGENALSISAKASLEESLPVLVSQLTAEEHRRFVDAAQSDKRANIIFAPKVTIFNGQHADISDVVQRPYVTAVGFTREGAQRPQRDLVDDGLRIKLAPEITAEGNTIHLTSQIALTNIVDVMTLKVQLRGENAFVQSPKVSACCFNISAAIPDGKTLLACVSPLHGRTDYTYVMLTPKLLPVGVDRSE